MFAKRNLRGHDTTEAKRLVRLTNPAEDELFKLLWIRRNFGLLAEVARELGVSGSFVRAVYWGKRRSKRVEDVLATHGVIVGPPVRRRHAKAA